MAQWWNIGHETHTKRAGHEVPGVVAVLRESLGMGGYRERDMPRMGLSVPFACKSCKTKQNKQRVHICKDIQGMLGYTREHMGTQGYTRV